VAAWRVSVLEGELMATHRDQDMIEEKLPSMAAKVATAHWRWVAVEE
jgi:hypothetical protein